MQILDIPEGNCCAFVVQEHEVESQESSKILDWYIIRTPSPVGVGKALGPRCNGLGRLGTEK